MYKRQPLDGSGGMGGGGGGAGRRMCQVGSRKPGTPHLPASSIPGALGAVEGIHSPPSGSGVGKNPRGPRTGRRGGFLSSQLPQSALLSGAGNATTLLRVHMRQASLLPLVQILSVRLELYFTSFSVSVFGLAPSPEPIFTARDFYSRLWVAQSHKC